MAEPMCFLTASIMLKIVILVPASSTALTTLAFVPMWPKSYRNTGPEGTDLPVPFGVS